MSARQGERTPPSISLVAISFRLRLAVHEVAACPTIHVERACWLWTTVSWDGVRPQRTMGGGEVLAFEPAGCLSVEQHGRARAETSDRLFEGDRLRH